MEKNIGLDDQYFGFLFHYYRAEIYRETSWRNRMDVTSNWAIVVTAAILSFTFSDPNVPHMVIILNYVIVLFFLYIEARRFRYHTMLRSRTRFIEEYVLAPLFSAKSTSVPDNWGSLLAASLAQPKIEMSRLESIAWRLRRQYIFLLPIIFIAWIARIYMVPKVVQTFSEAVMQAHISIVPGTAVFVIFTSSLILAFALAGLYVPRAKLVDDLP